MLCFVLRSTSQLTSIFIYINSTVSTFVPKHGVAPMPKAVSSLAKVNQARSRNTNNKNSIKMMPIGVPKVAYRVPGSPSADW